MNKLNSGVSIFVLTLVALFYLVLVPVWAWQGAAAGQYLNTIVSQSAH